MSFKIPSKKTQSNRSGKWIAYLFVFMLFFPKPIIGLLKEVVLTEAHQTYFSSTSEYAADFPDTFQISIPSHWNIEEYGRKGFRNQKNLRISSYQPAIPIPFRDSPHIKVHWREKGGIPTNISHWFWLDIMGQDSVTTLSSGNPVRIGATDHSASRYDVENQIIILTTSDAGDFAIIIFSRDEILAEQLFNMIKNSFVVSVNIND